MMPQELLEFQVFLDILFVKDLLEWSGMPTIPEGKRTIYSIVPEELADALDQYRFKRQFRSVNAAVIHLLRYALKANPPKPEDAK